MRKSKKAIVAGATAAALVGGGVAYAYWTTSGSGSGTGSTTAGVVNQLSFTQNTLTAMYPGDHSQDLTVTVKNTDANESAYVSTVKAYITTDKGGCTGADFLLGGVAAPSTSATAAALTWTARDIAAGAQYDATSTIQFNNTGDNQNACKTALVTLNYVAS